MKDFNRLSTRIESNCVDIKCEIVDLLYYMENGKIDRAEDCVDTIEQIAKTMHDRFKAFKDDE